MPERMKGLSRLVVGASAAVMLAAGCGSQSAEPEDKDWDGGSQSEQQSDGSKGKSENDGQSDSDQKNGNDDKKVIRGDDGENAERTGAQIAAEKLIADYLDALNKATKDGNFARTEPMIEDCTVCKGSRETIEPVYQDGGKVEGGLFADPKIRAGRENDGTVTVTVVSEITAYKILDSSGTETDSGPAETQTNQYGVARKGGEWKIVSGNLVK